MRDKATVVRTLGVIPHRHLLSRGSCSQLWLDLTATGLALGASTHCNLVTTGHTRDLTPWVFTAWACPLQLLLLLFLLLLLLLLLDIVIVSCVAVELRASRASIFVETFTTWSVSRVGLVDGKGIHLRVL